MKHLFTSLLLIAISGSVAAQSNTAARPSKAGRAHHVQGSNSLKPHGGAAKGGGGCLFSEDFEGGSIPAGWDTGGQVEQYEDDPDGAPLGTFVDAWFVDNATNANNGGFFDVPDEPAGNLFAYINDDGDPCNCGLTNVGLVTPLIDLTGQTGVGLTARIWHDGQYAASSATIEARIGTGSAWTTIYTVAENAAWQDVAVVLTAYENQADVQFRFQWDDGGGWGTGLGVDDVCITQLSSNDLALTGSWLSPDAGNWEDPFLRNLEYRVLPLVEAIPLTVSAPIINNGSADQTGVTLSATIVQNGNTYGPYSSDPVSLPPGERDTLVVTTGWTASETGEVVVTYTLASDDPSDANPDDNTATQTYMITGAASSDGSNAMGVDMGSLDGFQYLSGNLDSANYDALGTRFQVEGVGNMAYAIGVAFYEATTPGTLANVFLLDAEDEVASVLDVEILAEDLNGAGGNYFKIIPLDEPVELDPDMDYEVFVENVNPERVAVGLSGEVVPGGLLGHEIDATQNVIYIGFGNPALMVRLYLAETVGIGEQTNNGLTLGAAYPNPADRMATIPYSLATGEMVSYQLMDVNGKVVATQNLGRMGAGQHQLDVDVTELASGAYSLTLMTGDALLTRKVVVAH